MSQSYTCGETGALVAYLYDECEPELRESIDAHLGQCASCASEIEGLGRTRRQFGAWTPPVAELGFQMPPPAFETKLPWWRAPLPAWAQAAAAMLIFGTGLLFGASGGPAGDGPVASVSPVSTSASTPASRNDLSQMETRLRAEMTRLRSAAPAAAPTSAVPAATQASGSDEAIMRRVQDLVAESEKGLRTEITLRAVDLRRDFEMARRVDLASVRESVGQWQGVTNAEIRRQTQAIDTISNILVSQQAR
jgi:hypothetical protein